MDIVSKAMHFAVDAFDGQKRKGDGTPAVLHAMEAAVIASSLTNEDETICAAVLHDVAEDAGISPEQIRNEFGDRVAELVSAETEDKCRDVPPDKSWKIRKERTINELISCTDVQIKIVMLGDKLSNIRSFYNLKQQLGSRMWDKFNQSDPEMHHWYYRTIADNMKELEHSLAWKEYNDLICEVFNEK